MSDFAQPSRRMQLVKPSPTNAAAQRARELRSQGRDILLLTTGEPDFDTPPHVIEAAHRAMLDGETRYTAPTGTAQLKAAICDKFRRENGLEFDSSEVLAANGCKQVIFNALFATLEPEEEVIIPAPFWASYPDMVLIAGGRPVIASCRREDGYKLTPEGLESVLTARSRWLILNSPSNPAGVVYSAEELSALADIVQRHPRLLVMTDDIYEHILFEGVTFQTLARVRPDLRPRILTMNGVSKTYSMTGWRLGYAGGPAWLVKEMGKLQSQTTSAPSSISQAAAVAALNGPQDFIAEQVGIYRTRRDKVMGVLNQVPGLDCLRPDGAFYVYVSCEGLIGRTTPEGQVLASDHDVAMYFLNHAGVATVHGEVFGLSPYLRLSIATATDILTEACARIGRAVGDLR